MNHHKVTGGGGIRIHAVEAGNPKGRAILFIHGHSQYSLAWERQFGSDLANDCRWSRWIYEGTVRQTSLAMATTILGFGRTT